MEILQFRAVSVFVSYDQRRGVFSLNIENEAEPSHKEQERKDKKAQKDKKQVTFAWGIDDNSKNSIRCNEAEIEEDPVEREHSAHLDIDWIFLDEYGRIGPHDAAA